MCPILPSYASTVTTELTINTNESAKILPNNNSLTVGSRIKSTILFQHSDFWYKIS